LFKSTRAFSSRDQYSIPNIEAAIFDKMIFVDRRSHEELSFS